MDGADLAPAPEGKIDLAVLLGRKKETAARRRIAFARAVDIINGEY